ncbi:MAG: type II secretion system protein [Methylophilaceae bacterium]|nr:type II secretion system protein [Methylophilaceae bacterium]
MNPITLIRKQSGGFSLVEMAVVLVILGFVISALLLPLQGQREIGFRTQTENQLEIARKALIGFAQANGRLPCPAIDGATGVEVAGGGGVIGTDNCAVQLGFLPAVTLGITPTDVDGYAIDAWNNRIMYAVSQNSVGGAVTADFTTSGDMNTVGISALNPNDLRVCNSSTNCSNTIFLINNAVAVIYSRGQNAAIGGGPDELNQGNDLPPLVFYSRTPTASTSVDGEFDDMVVWISPYVLYNAMITAGQLR